MCPLVTIPWRKYRLASLVACEQKADFWVYSTAGLSPLIKPHSPYHRDVSHALSVLLPQPLCTTQEHADTQTTIYWDSAPTVQLL